MASSPGTAWFSRLWAPAVIGWMALYVLRPTSAHAQARPWTIDTSLYFLAASMSGEVEIAEQTADIDAGFDEIMESLQAGAMGSLRFGYERWAFTTDVLYMSLGGSNGDATTDLEELIVEPLLSYAVGIGFEVLAGVRYIDQNAEI